MIIGVTGSIGSGKTTVAKSFGKIGYYIIDADEISHQLIKKSSVAYKEILKDFGAKILDSHKNIDRKKLGDAVFNDKIKLKKLNSIIHPLIINEIKNQIKKIQNKCGYKSKIAIDAPLLLETETKNLADRIIVVNTGRENIIKRLAEKYSGERIERILNTQMPLKKKLKYADFVIDNNKDLKHLRNQVKKITGELKNSSNENSGLSGNF